MASKKSAQLTVLIKQLMLLGGVIWVSVWITACRHVPHSIVKPQAPEVNLKESLDLKQLQDETLTFLKAYLQLETVNPPGNELKGATLIAEWLKREGINYELVPLKEDQTGQRASLIATLPATDSSSNQGALCLLSHIDVVPSNAQRWKHPPHSGVVVDGELWGRGALDMKGVGAVELGALIGIKRLNRPLKRPLTLIAVADEEVDNRGMLQLIEERWEQLNCSHIINEGGMGIKEPLFKGQDVFAVSVGEKGVLWLKLTVSGPSGHGSTPRGEFAPARLLTILKALQEREPELNFHESLLDLFSITGSEHGGLKGFVLSRPSLLSSLGAGELRAEPGAYAALINTLHITGLNTGDHQPNVVPGEASAFIDARLLPGVTQEMMMNEIMNLIPSELRKHVKLEVLHSVPAGVTSWADDVLYALISEELQRAYPNALVAPALSVGFTDSIYARQKGVKAFGIAPFLVTKKEAQTMHGEDERISLENLQHGLEVMLKVVARYCW